MSRVSPVFLFLVLIVSGLAAKAAAMTHVIAFGKPMLVQWDAGTEGSRSESLKIRALLVDTRVREYITGSIHEVTDRLFVARRAFRVNDSLPEDSGSPHWQWQRGGWLLVDRLTGRISAINLPEFDALYSATSWYRDYVAYCGVSDDGSKIYAIVAQLNRRKPVLKKQLSGSLAADAAADSACSEPYWQGSPARVTFDSTDGGKQTFAIRGHVVDLVNDAEEDEEASK